ncbi:MAG: hypothetical protein AVDCRST_MAG76-3488, partial [uncultured Acidimicrobiales bacterium]
RHRHSRGRPGHPGDRPRGGGRHAGLRRPGLPDPGSAPSPALGLPASGCGPV